MRTAPLIEACPSGAEALPQFLFEGAIRTGEHLPLLDHRGVALGCRLPGGGVRQRLGFGHQRLARRLGLYAYSLAVRCLPYQRRLQFGFRRVDLGGQGRHVSDE